MAISRSELLELIENGENYGVEFKRDDLRPEQLAREIVALANFRGGRILLGVEDDGSITGIRRDGLERWVMDTVFARYVHPSIDPLYEEVQVDEKHRVAVITVEQGVDKPYVVRHNDREEMYFRVGSTTRLATREQQVRLSGLGGLLHPEELPVSGSSLADLSRDHLEGYLSSIMRDPDLPRDDEEWHRQLCDLGFMVERGDGTTVCTIAGLVLFGHAPCRRLPRAGIRWVAFEGDDKDYDALDDQIIDGPLVPLLDAEGRRVGEGGAIERLIAAMQPFVSRVSLEVEVSMRRERKWWYPLEALREVIVNAVAHRDWTRNENIEVIRYADRLEIQSPGALPNSMTVEKMKGGRHSARNQKIMNVLRRYGYIDMLGMGVRRKIIPLLREQTGVEPEFVATEDHLKVIMHGGAPDMPVSRENAN